MKNRKDILSLAAFTLLFSGGIGLSYAQFDGGLIEGRCENEDDPLCVGDMSEEPLTCEGEIHTAIAFDLEFGPFAEPSIVNRSPRFERHGPILAQVADIALAARRENRLFALYSRGSVVPVEHRGGAWIKVLTVSRLDDAANHIDFMGLPFQGDRISWLSPCMKQRTPDGALLKHQCPLVAGSLREVVCKLWKDGSIVGVEGFIKTRPRR